MVYLEQRSRRRINRLQRLRVPIHVPQEVTHRLLADVTWQLHFQLAAEVEDLFGAVLMQELLEVGDLRKDSGMSGHPEVFLQGTVIMSFGSSALMLCCYGAA